MVAKVQTIPVTQPANESNATNGNITAIKVINHTCDFFSPAQIKLPAMKNVFMLHWNKTSAAVNMQIACLGPLSFLKWKLEQNKCEILLHSQLIQNNVNVQGA